MVRHLLRERDGFTLTEMLIVIAIVMILMLMILINWRNQISKGYDARRKNDLSTLSRTFEELFNDTQAYPADGAIAGCGGTALAPYLASVPCDPTRRTPYLYVAPNGTQRGYVLCAALQNTGDADITRIGCNPITGCGWGAGYNYCISSGMLPVAEGFDPEIIPSVTVAPTGAMGGNYACTPGGNCNVYSPPLIWLCPQTFSGGGIPDDCNGMCGTPSIRCPI